MPRLSEMWIGGCPPLGLLQSPGLEWWGKLVNTENCFLSISLVFSLFLVSPPPPPSPLLVFKCIHWDSLCLFWLSSLCQPEQRLFLARWSGRFWFPGEYSNCPSIQVFFKFGYGLLDWWLIKQVDHRSHYWGYLHVKKKKKGKSVTLHRQEKRTVLKIYTFFPPLS